MQPRGSGPGAGVRHAVPRIRLTDEPAHGELERGMPEGDRDSRPGATAFLLTLRDSLLNTRQNQSDSSSSCGEFTTAGETGTPWGGELMSTRNTRALAASLLGAMACFAGPAQGAGFAIIEHSAQGMGNAFAGGGALAEDASTVWFNPASITRRPNEVQASTHVILPSFEFTNQRAVTGAGAPIRGTTNIDGGTDAVVPNLYYIRKLDGPFTFGLSVNVPFGLKTEYNTSWVGRYQALKSEIKTVHINPVIAYKATDRLSIGGGINAQYMDATLSSAVDFSSACLAVAAAAGAAGNLAQAGALNAACAPSQCSASQCTCGRAHDRACRRTHGATSGRGGARAERRPGAWRPVV